MSNFAARGHAPHPIDTSDAEIERIMADIFGPDPIEEKAEAMPFCDGCWGHHPKALLCDGPFAGEKFNG